MEEHKNFKRPKQPSGSIDGMVSGNRQIGIDAHRTYQPNRGPATPSLDNFVSRGDGFHPNRQPTGRLGQSPEEAETEALLDEPILLDVEPTTKRRHYFGHRRPKLRKFIKRTAVALAILVLVMGSYLGLKFYFTQRQILAGGGGAPAVCGGDVSLNQLKKEGDSRVNTLLLGIGSEGVLTDTLMLASLDPATHKMDLLSIPRDLWVQILGRGTSKLNATYEYGQQGSYSNDRTKRNRAGISLMDQTLEPVLGIPIHYHVIFNFDAFKSTVNALGGVRVNVPETLYDPTIAWENHYNSVIATKGIQDMSGARALLYVKSRETSSDFKRAERQRIVLTAIKDKALSLGTFSNPLKVSQLLGGLGRNVYSDLDARSTKCLYNQISQVPSSKIASLDLVTPPHDLLTTANMNGQSVVEPKAGLFDYSQVQDYVRSTLRDSFLAKENDGVAIYNATNLAGLAGAQDKALRANGYRVVKVDNTPSASNPATTTIVDFTKGRDKYTRNYLQTRFGVTARGNLPSEFGISPPRGTAFVIILGTDASTISPR